MLCLPHLIQFVSQLLLHLLEYEFLLSHLSLHILKFLSEVLARVLPLSSHLSLCGLEVGHLRLQISRLAVLSIQLLLQCSHVCPSLA